MVRSWWMTGACAFWMTAAAATFSGCAPVGDEQSAETTEDDADAITGTNAVARTLTVQSYVYVDTSASDATILDAVRRQTRTMFGSLRNLKIGLDDRELHTIDPSTFHRETVTVIDTEHRGVAARPMLRVRYSYSDRAVVDKSLQSRRSLATTMLAANYLEHADDVITQCTDDPEARDFGPSGLWYMFNPAVSTCVSHRNAEARGVDDDSRQLTDRRTQVTASEVARWFLPVTVTLETIRAPRTTKYPEYDRLFGIKDPSKTEMNVYAFFGVIGENESDPQDEGYLEMMRVLRYVLRAYPTATFTSVSPETNLLDIRPNGTALTGVTYARVLDWAIDHAPPSGVSRTALQAEIARVWRNKQIQLTLPMTVTSGRVSHPLNVNVRAYYGDEGSAWSTEARQRYISSWHDADVFIYSGHSHLGSGPLDPANYRASDFPDRYQIMMINSCVSFNYYNRDFYPLHPGGSQNLDMIVNGTEALGDNGWSVSQFIVQLINGRQYSYLRLLQAMVVTDESIGLDHYDPLRVADGELDNVFTPSHTTITLSASH